jgi:hypothetical protein
LATAWCLRFPVTNLLAEKSGESALLGTNEASTGGYAMTPDKTARYEDGACSMAERSQLLINVMDGALPSAEDIDEFLHARLSGQTASNENELIYLS